MPTDDGSKVISGALRERRMDILVLATLLAIFATVHVLNLNKTHNWGGDFSAYVMQAQGLATGQVTETYDMLAFFFNHSTRFIAPVVYPWGFPLLLAPVYGLFGLNVIALKCVVLVFLLGSLAVIFLLYRLGLTTLQSALAVSVLGMSPTFLGAGTEILSDLPFLFFCMSAVLLIQCCVVRRQVIGRPWFSATLLGICLFMSYFTRSIGFVLLPTLFVAQLYVAISPALKTQSKTKAWLGNLIPYGVFFLALVVSRLAPPTGYVELVYSSLDLSSLIASVSGGISYYINIASTFFAGLSWPVTAISAIFAILGICVRFREDWVYVLFSLLYLAVLVIWPYHVWRYLYPVLPIYVYFAFMGARFLSSITILHPPGFRSFRLPLDYGLFLVLLIYFAYLLPPFPWSHIAQDARGGPFGPAAQEVYHYIRANLSEDAVIEARKPRVLMLLTGRRGVIYGKAADIGKGVATHYLVQQKNNKLLRKEYEGVTDHPDSFVELFSNSEFRLYRVISHF